MPKDNFQLKMFSVGMTDGQERADYYMRWQIAFCNRSLCEFCDTDRAKCKDARITKNPKDKVVECDGFSKKEQQD